MTTPDVVPADHTAPERPGPGFWIGLIIGGAVMAFGIRGVVTDFGRTQSVNLALWVIGADILHDLLIAPIAIGIGWTVARVVPRTWRTPVNAGLVASGILLAIAWPALRGYGRSIVPDNPSVQPLDSTTAVAWVLAAVWIAVTVWLAARTMRARSQR